MLIHLQNYISLPKYQFVDTFFPVVYECETYLDEERELQMLEDKFLWEVWVQFSVLHIDELCGLYFLW
jgi:hypothetical protein